MSGTDALVERLRAERCIGFTIGGGSADAATSGASTMWGSKRIMSLVNPDGPEAATALTRQAERIAVLEAVARAYLEDAKRWKFDGPGVAAARAALAKEARDG